jgi:tartrate-resistant acid phosphatase type 5
MIASRPAIIAACIIVLWCCGAAQDKIRFAVIGDYGYGLLQPETDVAALIKGWAPDFIVTVGDNNYPNGAASTIDDNIGRHFQEFIHPYTGAFGPGDTVNRFFPALGNHDWNTAGALPCLAYFELPGNERYYDFVRGDVHFFILDSDPHEPDGNGASSVQAAWLQSALAGSTSLYNLVFLHHAPYSSGLHGSIVQQQWPYKAWGATAVLAGHDHDYERLGVDGLTYFVNGLGGAPYRGFNTPVAGSEVRFTGDYGAMLIEADTQKLTFEFKTRNDSLVDRYSLYGVDVTQETLDVAAGWDLVSLPLRPIDSSLTALFPGALTPAYAFDASGYATEDTLSTGRGYWVKFGAAADVVVAGYAGWTDTIEVIEGWNIIPAPATPAPVGGIIEDPPGLIASQFFGYSAGYVAADTLVPGKAYWVKASGPGRLVLR